MTPHSQIKVEVFLLYLFESFTWLIGVSRENCFYPTNMQPQHQLSNCLYYTPFGALRCKRLRIANVRETDTPKATYMVQAICQAWNKSSISVRVRLVGAASSEQCRNTRRVHVRG